MQVIFNISPNNKRSNRLLIYDINFSSMNKHFLDNSDFYDNNKLYIYDNNISDVKSIQINNYVKILNTILNKNNSLISFCIINQCNRVTNIASIFYKTGL